MRPDNPHNDVGMGSVKSEDMSFSGRPHRGSSAIQWHSGMVSPRFVGLLMALVISGCVQNASDRDQDGLSDDAEVRLGTDPDNVDTDNDGVTDADEIQNGTSPLQSDSDGDGVLDGDDADSGSPVRDENSVSTGNDIEPNDGFRQAVTFSGEPKGLSLRGRIDRAGDIDVFDLGSLDTGDRFVVDFIRRSSSVHPNVALFDDAESAVLVRFDPFLGEGPDIAEFVDVIIRHPSSHYYLAVAPRSDDGGLGDYDLEVEIERAGDAPRPIVQTLFLDFDGGALDVPLLGVRAVGAFDAADISAVYAGETEELKKAIVDTVVNRFAGFAVTILTSDVGEPEGVEGVSRLLIGGLNTQVFGVSEGVDLFNADRCDDGIIFAETFRPAVFGFRPSVESLAVAIGNVTAHEAGHLLGLRHVTDATAIMDEASPAPVLLREQQFKIAPLSQSVFPVGFQNDPELLAETVGLSERAADRRIMRPVVFHGGN